MSGNKTEDLKTLYLQTHVVNWLLKKVIQMPNKPLALWQYEGNGKMRCFHFSSLFAPYLYQNFSTLKIVNLNFENWGSIHCKLPDTYINKKWSLVHFEISTPFLCSVLTINLNLDLWELRKNYVSNIRSLWYGKYI